MSIHITPAEPYLAHLMDIRQEDLDEIARYDRGSCPHAAVADTVRQSTAKWAAWDPSGLIAIGGVVPSIIGLHPWVICGPNVKQHRLALLRAAREVIQALRETGLFISNSTPRKGPREERFLQHLGFTVLHMGDHSVFHLE